MANDQKKPKVEPVSDKEMIKIREAVAARFGHRLRPGETLSVDVERKADHSWATVVIEMPDDSFRLELEAASQASDQSDEWSPREALERVLDLLDAQLDEYFEQDRELRFHDDWRIYEIDDEQLRFRGAERRPEIEALADQWLARGGPPDPSDLN